MPEVLVIAQWFWYAWDERLDYRTAQLGVSGTVLDSIDSILVVVEANLECFSTGVPERHR